MRATRRTSATTALVVGVVALLAACGVYDAGPNMMQVFNDTSSDVVVSITDTDISQVVGPGGGGFPGWGKQIRGRDCVGTGIVVAKPDGTVIASYKGPACGYTAIRVMKDGSVLADNGQLSPRTSEPLPSTTPTDPPVTPSPTPSSPDGG